MFCDGAAGNVLKGISHREDRFNHSFPAGEKPARGGAGLAESLGAQPHFHTLMKLEEPLVERRPS
jgi:hypothetical protein